METKQNQDSKPTCDGLLIYCSDFRFWRTAFNYMLEDLKITKFDILCYPGSAINLCKDLSTSRDFLEKIRFLEHRHDFHTIVIANHTDCGGYGGKESYYNLESEKQAHSLDLMSAKSKLISELPHVKIIPIYISQTADSIKVERVL